MSGSRWVAPAIAVTSVTVSAAGVALIDGLGPGDLLFGTIVLALFLTALRVAGRAGRRVTTERRRAQRSKAAQEETIRRALTDERARLTVDIEGVVRQATLAMSAHAATAARRWEGDPEPALHEVQAEGERAGIELRRLLGLLRDPVEQPSRPGPVGPEWSIPRDVVPAALVTTLALAESTLWAVTMTTDPWPVLMTVLTAATVVFRRVAPGPGAACCGLLFALSVVTVPVSSGFWVIATVGGLMWAATARRTLRDLAGAAVLAAGASAGFAVRDPQNLGIVVAVLVVACAGGSVVGWGTAATARADRRTAEQAAATEQALRTQRLAVARELHDVVSHAVGVMVMQAGAALALRAIDRPRARRALDIVRATAAAALDEFDALVAVLGAGPADDLARSDVALPALVDRMRAAGLAVHLHVDGPIGGEHCGVVYRVVQETLTNVVRHAPGAAVRVTVLAQPDGVTVEVVDDGPGPAGIAPGYGLVGLAERVQRLGGELSTGPGLDAQGFRVTVRLPAPAELRR